MRTTTAIHAAALATLAGATPLQAHHSGTMYERTAFWVKGTVVSFEAVNPHTITTLEERSADGQTRRWAVEGPAQYQIERMDIATDVPQVGDAVEFCAFRYKSAAELSRMFPGVDFSARRSTQDSDGTSPQFVAGHILITAGAEKQLWEPHGLISECIRSSDEPRSSWAGFIDSSTEARQAWCEQRSYAHVRSNPALQELVEEIDSSIEDRCT